MPKADHQGPSDVAKYQENQRYCDWVQTDRHQATYGEDDRHDVDVQGVDAISEVPLFAHAATVPQTPHLSEFRLFAHAATVPQISIL